MVGNVYRRVKYLQKKLLEENLARVPTADAQEVTSLWGSSSSGGVSGFSRQIQWNERHINIIKEAFVDFTQCPKKAEIAQTSDSDNTLPEIINHNTFTRCYEKVNTIFKQLHKWKLTLRSLSGTCASENWVIDVVQCLAFKSVVVICAVQTVQISSARVGQLC